MDRQARKVDAAEPNMAEPDEVDQNEADEAIGEGVAGVDLDRVGCTHYKRNCALLAPCCKKVYTCRVCHDETEMHEMDRHQVTEIKCLLCQKQQSVSSNCTECGVQFAVYFCDICRLYDNKDKKQFHCDQCGICRVGGRENFFHCIKCDVCLSIEIKDTHKCIEKVSHSNCAVCLEDLHTSRRAAHIPPCGHLIHQDCFRDMLKAGSYACPLCSQSMLNMSSAWESVDKEIAATEMPDEYKDFNVFILCRDCQQKSRVLFHVLGLKCQHCGSYNTSRSGDPAEEGAATAGASKPTE